MHLISSDCSLFGIKEPVGTDFSQLPKPNSDLSLKSTLHLSLAHLAVWLSATKFSNLWAHTCTHTLPLEKKTKNVCVCTFVSHFYSLARLWHRLFYFTWFLKRGSLYAKCMKYDSRLSVCYVKNIVLIKKSVAKKNFFFSKYMKEICLNFQLWWCSCVASH